MKIHRPVPWNKGFKRPVGVPVPWSHAKTEALKKGLAEGQSYLTIAKALGTSEKTVLRHAQRLGLKSVHKSRDEAKAFWTPERQAQLVAMCQEGKSWREITEFFDRGESNCRIWVKRLGAVKADGRENPRATNGKAWSKEDDARLWRLTQFEGRTRAEAAKLLNRTPRATHARMAYLNRTGFEIDPKPLRPDLSKMRKCLGIQCGGKMFRSHGPGNRLCERCKYWAGVMHEGHV